MHLASFPCSARALQGQMSAWEEALGLVLLLIPAGGGAGSF